MTDSNAKERLRALPDECETPRATEYATSKDKISDFDIWRVAYEIYCAGGYVDDGSEPNPPTDGIRELLKIQAATLERGTCEPKWTLQGKTQTQEFWCCECGGCGHAFGMEDRSTFPFKVTIDKVDVPNFCPE